MVVFRDLLMFSVTKNTPGHSINSVYFSFSAPIISTTLFRFTSTKVKPSKLSNCQLSKRTMSQQQLSETVFNVNISKTRLLTGKEKGPFFPRASHMEEATPALASSVPNVTASPSKPKRTLNVYNLFFKHHRKLIKEEQGGVGFGDLAREIASRWRKVSDE